MARVIGIARLRDNRPYKERGDDYILVPFHFEIEGDYEEDDIVEAVIQAVGLEPKTQLPYVFISWKEKPTEI